MKPLPTFLFSLDCWERILCINEQLYEAACGFLLSYAWLIQYESDLRIAHEEGLLPNVVELRTWTNFIADFLAHINLETLSGISPRFRYGELRMSRLNRIAYINNFRTKKSLRGFMTSSTWSGEFFVRKFGWLLTVFAFLSLALSAMQVVLAIPWSGKDIEHASYGFSIASLLLILIAVLVVSMTWGLLIFYNLLKARRNNQAAVSTRGNVWN